MYISNCCFLTCIQVSSEAGQVVWFSHLFKNFPQFVVIHIVKSFGIVNKAEINVFLALSCFFDDLSEIYNSGKNWISDSFIFFYLVLKTTGLWKLLQTLLNFHDKEMNILFPKCEFFQNLMKPSPHRERHKLIWLFLRWFEKFYLMQSFQCYVFVHCININIPWVLL